MCYPKIKEFPYLIQVDCTLTPNMRVFVCSVTMECGVSTLTCFNHDTCHRAGHMVSLNEYKLSD